LKINSNINVKSNRNINNHNNILFHNKARKSISYNKNNFKNPSLINYKKNNGSDLVTNYSYSTYKHKNHIMRTKNYKNSIEINNTMSKKKYNISSNIQDNESKQKSLSKQYENSVEPTKKNNKNNFIKHNNSTTLEFINKIKNSNKKNATELLNKFTNINNINIHIFNKASLFPIISKLFKESKKDGALKEKMMNINKKEIEIKKIKANIKEGYANNNKKRDKIKNKIVKINNNICLTDNIFYKKKKDIIRNNKIKTHININSLFNSFNKKEKINRKNNQSLFNFGNIFFIDQSQLLKKKDTDMLSSNIHEKSNRAFNRIKAANLNEIYDHTKLNTLNFSIIRQRPQIINNFSNYKKKGNISYHKFSEIKNESPITRNINQEYKIKRISTEINDNTKNYFNNKNKISDFFKLRKVEDSGKRNIKVNN
jgi:hypothetical protein